MVMASLIRFLISGTKATSMGQDAVLGQGRLIHVPSMHVILSKAHILLLVTLLFT